MILHLFIAVNSAVHVFKHLLGGVRRGGPANLLEILQGQRGVSYKNKAQLPV